MLLGTSPTAVSIISNRATNCSCVNGTGSLDKTRRITPSIPVGVELLNLRLKFGPDREKRSLVRLHPAVTAVVVSRHSAGEVHVSGIAGCRRKRSQNGSFLHTSYMMMMTTMISDCLVTLKSSPPWPQIDSHVSNSPYD